MRTFLFTFLGLIFYANLYSLQVGNPADPLVYPTGLVLDQWCEDYIYDESYEPYDPCRFDWRAFSIRLGYYGDFVFNRKMLDKADHHRIDEFEIDTNAGLFVFNFWERIDLYATLGTSKIFIDTSADPFITPFFPGGQIEVETDSHFSWSCGIRAILWQSSKTVLGINAAYLQSKPDIERVTFLNTFSVYPERNTLEIRYKEWQIGLSLAYQLSCFIPYVCIKCSDASADISGVAILSDTFLAEFFKFKNQKIVGYVVGVALLDFETIGLTIEGRFRDEHAVSTNLQIRF